MNSFTQTPIEVFSLHDACESKVLTKGTTVPLIGSPVLNSVLAC